MITYRVAKTTREDLQLTLNQMAEEGWKDPDIHIFGGDVTVIMHKVIMHAEPR